MTIDPVIATIVRFALGWLFLAAAAHKLADMAEFRTVLSTYRVLPERLVGVASWWVVAVEILIGLAALWQQSAALVAAIAVLLGYGLAMALNLARGRRFIDCGCGGVRQPLSLGLVLRNVVLASGALIALQPIAQRPLNRLDVAGIVAGVVVLGALYASVNQLLAARARLEEWV